MLKFGEVTIKGGIPDEGRPYIFAFDSDKIKGQVSFIEWTLGSFVEKVYIMKEEPIYYV